MNSLRSVLLIALIAAGFVGGYGYGRWYGPRLGTGHSVQKTAEAQRYHCPMHPTYISDKPGDCPICGMRLVPLKSEEEHVDAAPVDADDPSAMPMGTIRVSPDKQQLIGVRYGAAEYTAGVHTFRAVGKVAFDETRIARVQTKTDGWIDEVHVDFIGKLVKKGQPLLTFYSPEMLATQDEFLLALKSQEIMRSSPLNINGDGPGQQATSLVAAARRRLELWDLSEDQIQQIARTGKTFKNITLYSPISGYVMKRNAFPKQRITPETELYTLVDLSKVWIMAEVFESEAPMVRLGMPATVTLSTGGRRLPAKVDYIQPQIEAMTRTMLVRLEAENAGLWLKPDMFVDVDFRMQMPRRVTVASEAVLDSGLRQTVFVDRGNGYLEPRQVETGERVGGRIEIVKGLREGERVVTSGNFLIDSESQLKSSAAGMAGHQHGASPGGKEPAPATPSAGHEGHNQ